MKPKEGCTMLLTSHVYHEDGTVETLYRKEVPDVYNDVPEHVIHDWTEYKRFNIERWVDQIFNVQRMVARIDYGTFPNLDLCVDDSNGYKTIVIPLTYFQIIN